MKILAKDEYERNFISTVVPPHEIGVKFDDIGALEDVKKTLDELVTLPMRRPELFSHGSLLRPCKGTLLFGPPGTGKTLFGKGTCNRSWSKFYQHNWFYSHQSGLETLRSSQRPFSPLQVG